MRRLFLLILLFLNACTATGTPTPRPTAIVTVSPPSATPNSSTAEPPTATPLPTRQAPTTKPRTPAPAPRNVAGFQITTHDLSVSNLKWSDDSSILYYQTRELRPDDDLFIWHAYNLVTHIEQQIEDPTTISKFDWERLELPQPSIDDLVPVYPELHGRVSPSGLYAIYSLYYPPTTSDVFLGGTTEFWLVNSMTRQKSFLFEGGMWSIGQVEWSSSESIAVVNVGFEGPGFLYVVDTIKSIATAIKDELDNFCGCTEAGFDLSPDGQTIAMAGFPDGYLLTYSIASHTTKILVDERVYNPQWSKDGRTIYYSVPAPFGYYEGPYDFKSIHTESGARTTLISKSELDTFDSELKSGQFLISPNNQYLAVWYEQKLWVIQMPD